jgi:hypothetical protein
MDKVCVNVFFAQRGAHSKLDACNHVRLRFVRLRRNGGFFFTLHVAPHRAVYRNLQNPSNGADEHIGLRGEFSTENATGGDSIGLPDSNFQLWLRLPPATSVVQSGYE